MSFARDIFKLFEGLEYDKYMHCLHVDESTLLFCQYQSAKILVNGFTFVGNNQQVMIYVMKL
jgi:hypothetical protein